MKGPLFYMVPAREIVILGEVFSLMMALLQIANANLRQDLLEQRDKRVCPLLALTCRLGSPKANVQ